MSGVLLETCWVFIERWNNKFYYKVASCWLFLMNIYVLLAFSDDKSNYVYVARTVRELRI
jgi:hypothetical protein